MQAFAVGTEVVMVDEIPFPPQVTPSTNKPLSLLGHGKSLFPAPFFLSGVYGEKKWIVIMGVLDNRYN